MSKSSPPLLRPPDAVLEITRDLEDAGYQAWCVGGAVRDAILKLDHLDWDIATDATPDQVRNVFGRKRTIPVGVEHGTVGVLDGSGVMHEVTTFRTDVETYGRHADVAFMPKGSDVNEDLSRRDFTINAMAYRPARKEFRDPFDGQRDLDARVVRAVGDPPARMREDYLRALRALRFAARYRFEIEPATWEAIRASAPRLRQLSAERIQQELEKTMEQVRAPSRAISLWIESGAMAALVPELASIGAEALRALDCAAHPGLIRRPGRRLTRLAVLFSDVASETAYAVATRLRFSKDDARWVATLVDLWRRLDAPVAKALARGGPAGADVRRWVAAIGRPRLAAFFRVAWARWSARADTESPAAAPTARAVHSLYRQALRVSLRDPVDLRDLAIDGDDLRQAGIAPGPELGKILSLLLDAVLEDPRRNTRDHLLVEARSLHAQLMKGTHATGS